MRSSATSPYGHLRQYVLSKSLDAVAVPDELVVKINPVAVGAGVPLFDGPYSPQRYTVVSGKVYDSGVTVLTYARRD
ncbi:hypothetical protein [Streptomyces luteolus]|uniref:Uncharacterized protein n=1 Tax=Streptomyces luteolus TaxID=3043615 RepID=A0ABT6SQ25_9ACTN|nr:hypothetical protein [Streptomyces sp. B-S-A12]MDI3417709.1 hypothetical protein [Streptomyces sp. B-S-A12]